MKTLNKISALILIAFLLNIQTVKAQCNFDDWNALKALYESTNGDNWSNNTGWEEITGTSPTTLCNLENFIGVFLDVNGRVGILSLESNNLNGNIPPELGNLSNLTGLSLFFNELSGNIPPELGNLSNLTSLNLYYNELSGNIPPELGNLSNLISFKMYENKFNGNIPPELGNLSNLMSLHLGSSNLSGNIPPELGNLSNLTYLNLGGNNLGGNIPPELGNLSNLTYLRLDINELIGNIPSELGNLSNLTSLNLGRNDLGGNIPPELGNLSNLTSLTLYGNNLSGNIPPELENLSNLTSLSLHGNGLSGNIPPELGNLSNWAVLYISNNNLSGCFDNNLTILCSQLNQGNAYISDGNNFDAPWEDFCATGAGACDPCPPNCPNPVDVSDVYPGDLNNDGIVNNQDDAIHYLYYNYNNNNIPREEQGIDWQAYTCPDWGFAVPEAYGNDIKHFDCDGNGVINNQDKNAIILNWGSMHDEANFPGTGIYPFGIFPSNNKIYLQPTGNINNNLLIMNITLEHINNEPLNLFGGFFTVDYGDTNANILNAVADFNISWLGIPNGNLNMDFKDFPIEKKIEVAFSRTDGSNATGSGVIGQIAFTLDNTIQRQNGNAQILEFDAINVGAHNNVGSPISISNQHQPVNIGAVNCESSISIDQATPFQNLYQSNNTITTDNLVIVGQNQQEQYNANRVTLNEGFSVRAGADFKVRSGGCN